MSTDVTRRGFLAAVPSAALSAAVPAKPALLGGPKARTTATPSWPRFDQVEEKALLATLRSGKWFRGGAEQVDRFEKAYASLTGAPHCLATANGTAALFISLNVLGIEPGDEVILPPYTFIATANVILRQYALPVFVDSDLDTFQIDHRKVEAAITGRTRAIMPVHLGGNAADVDSLMAIGRKHNLPIIEDACQAHLAEWKGRKVGTYGDTGCFSFQASKNLNCGEGGAILFRDENLWDRAYAFHNNGRGLKTTGADFTYSSSGSNLRLTEFQAALLLAQMSRLEQQARTRSENGRYLTSMLSEIPGIRPARAYDGCTANAYHLYMLRYDAREFAGMKRAAFLKALAAEGVPASGGYTPLNTQPFLQNAISSRGFQRAFPPQRLKEWVERNQCPVNDRLCSEAVWFTQNVLLGSRTDMEQIVEAFRKIHAHAGDLVKIS